MLEIVLMAYVMIIGGLVIQSREYHHLSSLRCTRRNLMEKWIILCWKRLHLLVVLFDVIALLLSGFNCWVIKFLEKIQVIIED